MLDEPTSALDSRHEQLVQTTLATPKGKRTIVLVSHRVGTVMGCDRICVLDRGNIVEQGDHRELMRLDGIYAAMSKQQLDPNASGLTQAA